MAIEREANRFAAALLMPRELVLDAWGGVFGDLRSRIISDSDILDGVRDLSQKFLVSREAMRIRCEELGLLHRSEPARRFLRSAS